jgi:hypothetical protein
MKYSGQFTIDPLSQPILSALLSSEPSARKRSAAVTSYAELGCVFLKLVQSGAIATKISSPTLIPVGGESAAHQGPATDQLTNQLLDGIFSDFSFSSSDQQGTT